MKNNPLTGEQEGLRGRRVEHMTDAQLLLWIDACERMRRWVKPAKARRSWTEGRRRAEAEIESGESARGSFGTVPANVR
jgi:hypothetical protein